METTANTECSILFCYQRAGAAVYMAHLDNMRAFERAFGRASLPVKWSEEAYNPRPDLVFALPVGTGIATCKDPFVATFRELLTPDFAMTALNQVMIPDVSIVSAVPYVKKSKKYSVMSQVYGAVYKFSAVAIDRYLPALLRKKQIMVTKMSKGKETTVDLVPLINDIVNVCNDCVILDVKAGSRANLRPDLVLQALRDELSDPTAFADLLVTRLEVKLDLEGNITC